MIRIGTVWERTTEVIAGRAALLAWLAGLFLFAPGVLQAIMRSNGQAHAVISGQQVKVGDDLGGARLRAIYAHSVVLERQGQQEVLRLVEPIMKLSR